MGTGLVFEGSFEDEDLDPRGKDPFPRVGPRRPTLDVHAVGETFLFIEGAALDALALPGLPGQRVNGQGHLPAAGAREPGVEKGAWRKPSGLSR